MIGINNEKQNVKLPDGLEMYFDKKVASDFAKREQNEKHHKVAEIIEILCLEALENNNNLHLAELGGGAHVDRYNKLFAYLLAGSDNSIDWVDVSPIMLEEARRYLANCEDDRKEIINFKCKDIFQYLNSLSDNSLDLVIMKYVFEYIKNIDELFKLLNTKVKEEGFIIMTKGVMDSKLKSHSSNVHYAYNDELIPLGEERQLKDGDKIGMHFFAETDNPQAGYLDGAITSKYFYSMKIIRDLAKKYGFEIFIGEWDSYLQNRDNIPVGLKDFSQGVIILEK